MMSDELRRVRIVVECAALERRYRGNLIEGSNPSPSAMIQEDGWGTIRLNYHFESWCGFEKVARYFGNTWTKISTTCTETVSFESLTLR